jgi:ADP-ribose pyrophosphatase YjhB (NUDIX family)
MHDYLKALRTVAGHIPILVCGASVIVIDNKNRFLMHLRTDNNCWAFPGGAVDINERVEDAARRELIEETGLSAQSLEFFGVFSGADMYHIYPNGDEISNVDIVFLCYEYSGVLRTDNQESDRAAFFSIESIPTNISPPCVREVEKLKLILNQKSNTPT